MSPELFVLAIIGAIGTSATGIIVGVVSLFVSKKSEKASVTAETAATAAKVIADKKTDDIKTNVDDLGEKMLNMVGSFGEQLTKSLERENGDLRKSLSTQGELLVNQGKQLTALLESQKQIVQNNATIREENAGLRKDIDHYKQLVDDLQASVDKINAERGQEKSYIKTLERTISELKEAQDKSRQDYQRLLTEQGETLSSTKDELNARLQEIAELKAQVAEIGELRERVEALEKAVKAMTEEREQLIKRIDELTAERDAAIKRAEQAERERDAARIALQRAQDSTAKLDTQELTALVAKPPATGDMPKLVGDTPHA